jgi:hypothetical protein
MYNSIIGLGFNQTQVISLFNLIIFSMRSFAEGKKASYGLQMD